MLRACFNILNFEHVQERVAIKLRDKKLFEEEDKDIFRVIIDLPGHQKLRVGELTGFIVWIHNHGVQNKMSIHSHNGSGSGGQK